MIAKDISGQAPGGKRTPLSEVLPLDTPFVLQIFPIYACNFKCNYCIFSVKRKDRGFISNIISMDINLYKKCIVDMTLFPNKIKVLRFVGIGEPLLHKNISEMVSFAVLNNIANTYEILTNGSLLTPEMSDSLLSAGITRLVVSLQGTSSHKYYNVCGTNIDFHKFVDNLQYFYQNKGKAQVYIKIVDSVIDDSNEKLKFYEIFGNLCDTLAIEHTVPIHYGVNYESVLKTKDIPLTQFGLPVHDVHICPQPFFTLQINPDGNVVPCFSFEYPEIMGNCVTESVKDIWNGERYRLFRRNMLDGTKSICSVCANCNIIKYRLFPEDVINDAADRLKHFYDK